MKATIEISALLSALRVIGPALARTNSFRNASCSLSAADDRVIIRAASLDWDAEYVLPAQVAVAGTVWLPPDLVRALPFGLFVEPIEVRAGARLLEIRSGSIAYTLPRLEPDSVASLSKGLVRCADACGSTLTRILLLGASAAHQPSGGGTDDLGTDRPERDGAWLEIDRERVTVSSTDRTRVASASTAATSVADFRAALPIHAVLALARAAAQAETATLLRAKRDPSPALAIAAGPATVTVRTLSALPPDPTALDLEIPHTATTVRVAADRITTGLRAALAIAGTDPHAIVQLHGRRAHLDIHVTAGANRASATVALDHASGPEADVTLHARPLVAVLAPLGTAEVTLGLRGPGGPVSIAATEGSVRYRGLLAVTVDSGRPGRPVAATAGA